MPDFRHRIADGMARTGDRLRLALVPMLFALLDVSKIQSTLAFEGIQFGLRFGLPLSVVTVWQFVSVPSTGVSVNTGVPIRFLPFALVTVPALLVVQTALTAGYFGSVRNVLNGDPSQFVENSRRYFPPFLALTAIPYLAAVPAVLGTASATGTLGGTAVLFVLPALLVFLVAGYLFYATPYLVVLRDTGLVAAARQSYALAVQGGPYASYAIGFALFVFAVSPFATLVVVNIPFVGVLVGVLAGGYLGLGANLATMRFVADLDPGSSVEASWPSDARERAD